MDFEFPSLYEKLTARGNLRFFASLYKKHQPIDPLLESVGLLQDADKKVADYSKGMKSRLNFIKARCCTTRNCCFSTSRPRGLTRPTRGS